MKRWAAALLLLLMVLSLAACGGKKEETPAEKTPTWQEQYDLGIRYLSEGNYEEAIIAFTAAIEIDPKKLDAYTGLSNAYIAAEEYDKAEEVWAKYSPLWELYVW